MGFFFFVLCLPLQAIMPGHTPHKLPLALSSKHALMQSRGLHAEERNKGLKKRQHTCNFGVAKFSIYILYIQHLILTISKEYLTIKYNSVLLRRTTFLTERSNEDCKHLTWNQRPHVVRKACQDVILNYDFILHSSLEKGSAETSCPKQPLQSTAQWKRRPGCQK